MEIKYVPDGMMTEKQKKDVDILNQTCLAGDTSNPERVEVNMYDWCAPEDGMFLLFDGETVVGRIAVHKTHTEYNGQDYYLGGFGGLAILPEYQGKGYARQLADAALNRAYEIGVEVACMCVEMESGIVDFYQRLGFKFLNRSAYFVNWIDKEKSDDTVMIMGLNNKNLADEILKTNHKFHYGRNKGHW